MPQVPLPRVGLTTNPTPAYGAPSITPRKDYSGEQTQKLGAAMQQAGQVAMQIVEMERNEQDLASTKKFASQLQMKIAARVDDDYLLKLGEAAVGGSSGKGGNIGDKLIKSLREDSQTLQNELPTVVARGMYGDYAAKVLAQEERRIRNHQSRQRKVWLAQETATTINMEVLGSISAAMDTTESEIHEGLDELGQSQSFPQTPLWEQRRDVALDQVRDLAEQKGWGKDTTAAAIEETRTKIYSGIVTGFLDEEETSKAKEFLKDHGEDMNRQVAGNLNKLVKTASVGDDALRVAIEAKDRLGGERLDPVEVNAIGDEIQKRFLKGEFDAQTRDKILNYVKEMLGRHRLEAAHKAAEAKAKADGKEAASEEAKNLAGLDAFIGLDPKPTRSKLAKAESELPDKLDLAVKTGRLTEDEADAIKDVAGAIRWVIGAAASSMTDEIEEGMKAGAKPPHSSTSEWVRQMELQGMQKAKKLYPNDERLQIDFVMAHTAAIKKRYDLAVEKVDAQKAEVQDEMERYVEFNDVTDADAVPSAVQARWKAAQVMADARKLVKARTENRNDPASIKLFQASLLPGRSGDPGLRRMPTSTFNSMVAGLKGVWKIHAKQARVDAQANTPMSNSPLNQILRVMQNRGEFTGKGTKTQRVVADPNKPWEVSLMTHFIEEWHDRLDDAQAELDQTRSGAKLTDKNKLDIGLSMVVNLGDHKTPQGGTSYGRAEEITTRDVGVMFDSSKKVYEWHYKRMSDTELDERLGQKRKDIGVFGTDPKTGEEIWIDTEDELDLPEGTTREDRNRVDDKHRETILTRIARGDTPLRKGSPMPTKDDLDLIKALVDSAPTERTEERDELDRLFRKYGVTDRVPIGELHGRNEEAKLEAKEAKATALLNSPEYQPLIKELTKRYRGHPRLINMKKGVAKRIAKEEARAHVFRLLMTKPGALK